MNVKHALVQSHETNPQLKIMTSIHRMALERDGIKRGCRVKYLHHIVFIPDMGLRTNDMGMDGRWWAVRTCPMPRRKFPASQCCGGGLRHSRSPLEFLNAWSWDANRHNLHTRRWEREGGGRDEVSGSCSPPLYEFSGPPGSQQYSPSPSPFAFNLCLCGNCPFPLGTCLISLGTYLYPCETCRCSFDRGGGGRGLGVLPPSSVRIFWTIW